MIDATKKAGLRQYYRAVRGVIPEENRVERSAAIERLVLSSDRVEHAGSVFVYVSSSSEVRTHELIAALLDRGKTVAVPYYFGTHYLTYQMLEGFLPRDMISTCKAPNGSAARLDAVMNGEVDATTLTEAGYCRRMEPAMSAAV